MATSDEFEIFHHEPCYALGARTFVHVTLDTIFKKRLASKNEFRILREATCKISKRH